MPSALTTLIINTLFNLTLIIPTLIIHGFIMGGACEDVFTGTIGAGDMIIITKIEPDPGMAHRPAAAITGHAAAGHADHLRRQFSRCGMQGGIRVGIGG